jgi:hypothetical protein
MVADMRKSVSREIDEDIEDYLLEEAYQHLHDGARGTGEHLTREECAVLLKTLARLSRKAPRLPRKAPRLPRKAQRHPSQWLAIAVYSQLEHLGPVEAAVAATMDKYHVSRATVFAARERYDKYKQFLTDRLADRSLTHSAK